MNTYQKTKQNPHKLKRLKEFPMNMKEMQTILQESALKLHFLHCFDILPCDLIAVNRMVKLAFVTKLEKITVMDELLAVKFW